ncbi:head-tail adaptor protein [Clostridium butyricum]|uniref:head-tail adaptor protein n=1 Tax=Clostridium butyricum TaxID=1492 RepID=UPI0030C82E1D
MKGLTSRLRNKVVLYGRVPGENELGEDTFSYEPIKKLNAEIISLGGSTTTSEGETIKATTKHKITIRSNAIDKLKNDMYFMYRGQRYDIDYFNPNFKYDDSIVIMAKLIVNEVNDNE